MDSGERWVVGSCALGTEKGKGVRHIRDPGLLNEEFVEDESFPQTIRMEERSKNG
jgi:hypothetical protein